LERCAPQKSRGAGPSGSAPLRPDTRVFDFDRHLEGVLLVAAKAQVPDPLCLFPLFLGEIASKLSGFSHFHLLASCLILLYTLITETVNTLITEMQKKVGRPPGKTQDRPFQMKVNATFMAMVDDWRRNQPDMPSRAEAIRRMVALVAASESPAAAKPRSRPAKK
jgi:hypothetical protein